MKNEESNIKRSNFIASTARRWLFAATLGAASLNVASAVGIQADSATYGGHDYRLYTSSGISWTEARAEAIGLGAGWDLVSVTTAGENQFIMLNLLNFQVPVDRDHYWIGLNDVDTEGTYVWSNGDPYSFNIWHGSEPTGAGEDYIAYDYRSGGWAWNDIPNDNFNSLQKRYIVERVSVPDSGSTLALLGAALAGLVAVRRRRLAKA